MMKELFKYMITDFFERDLSGIYERDVDIPTESSKIITITGARRVGKTYLLFRIIRNLREWLPHEHLVYINFEDERLYPYKKEHLTQFLEAYYELHPDNRKHTIYFFLDEIQNIPQWHLFVRRLYDNENCRVYITGSSSKLLSRDLATALRGRTLNYELFPLSFKEYVRLKELDTNVYASSSRSYLLNAFDAYASNTAFPELIWLPHDQKQKALSEFYELLIYRDLMDRYNLTKVAAIKYLTKYLFINAGNFISYHKLFNDMNSQGFRIAKSTLYNYMEYLEDSYSLFTTSLFTDKIKAKNRNPRKIYILDNGLKQLTSIQPDLGRSLENIVFLHLRRLYQDIYYFKGKQEIDFCYLNHSNQLHLINVAFQVDSTATYNREIQGILEGMRYFNLSKGTIITREHEDTVQFAGKEVHLVPLWKWLLK